MEIGTLEDEELDSITTQTIQHEEIVLHENGPLGHVVTSEFPKTSRPQLPTSIKKLNRLLSYQRKMEIPESDLEERFDRGRGPGGQAINKTNSAVSLIHLPTGIRVQAQPTRSREENRKAARRILAEKLELLSAQKAFEEASSDNINIDGESSRDLSRKDKERQLAGVWSKQEIKWEKERRRKANRAKKSKKKKESGSLTGEQEVEEDK
ncbi:hypothetical protein M231_03408 [Tremella mesenterica]|uniref:Prokaryotic-type class I peptide chain release factors domain-containing protein n=1 Tax=Tremella mesenterica TaxID=5217 RepID=A0A4Q1BN96_TREME|nr:hypothetical protein M231_03408 [Tremella mesenterica]